MTRRHDEALQRRATVRPMERDELIRWYAQRGSALDEARRIVGSAEADDVVQDACLRAWTSSGEPIRSTGAWMTTTVRRLAFDTLRHREVVARFTRDVADEGVASPSVEDEVADRLAAADLLASIAGILDDAGTALLLLHVVFDETHADLGRRTGRTMGAMRVLIHRLRERVRRRLSESPADDAPASRDRDEARLRAFAVCWQAIRQRDPAVLHALLDREPGTAIAAMPASVATIAVDTVRDASAALVAVPATSPLSASSLASSPRATSCDTTDVPPVRVAATFDDGRLVLALRQGVALLCAMPVGVAADESTGVAIIG